MALHRYTAFGLCIESELKLPGVMPGDGSDGGEPDIVIRYGSVPASLPFSSDMGVAWQTGPNAQLLSVVDVARYLLINGRDIIVERQPGSCEEDVRVFLLGTAITALLYAREMTVLHASVMHTSRGAVLFLGRSGVGKSSLLSEFMKRGYEMLSDDMACVVVNGDGVPEVLPGYPRVRLEADAADKFSQLLQGSATINGLMKSAVQVRQYYNAPAAIRAVYALNTHNLADIRLDALAGLERFEMLRHHIHRRRYMVGTTPRRVAFRTLSLIASQVPLTRVTRPEHPPLIDALASRIEEDLRTR